VILIHSRSVCGDGNVIQMTIDDELFAEVDRANRVRQTNQLALSVLALQLALSDSMKIRQLE